MSKTYVVLHTGDVEIQYQRHRTRHILEVTSQFDVPTFDPGS